MGTSSLDPILSQSKFLNWIKAALAVRFSKEEIEPVVCDEIVQFQKRCINTVTSAAPSTCTSCSTETLLICPTAKICKPGKCNYHKNSKYRASGCPNKICNHIKSEIDKAHRFKGPSYKNTDATQWCSNPWEVAKCYMPPDGYKDIKSAADTDFNGIISIIITHTDVGAIFSEDLEKKNNIFEEGREVGKAVRHSPSLEVEDVDLTKYFTILNNMLADPGIANHKSSHTARKKLAKLQNDDLLIGKDLLRQVLEDAGRDMQEGKLELINTINKKIQEIEDQTDVSVMQLNETLKSSLGVLEAKEQELKDMVEQGKQTLENAASKGVGEVENAENNALKNIQETKANGSNMCRSLCQWLRYRRKKKEFKENLINFYKRKCSTVSLSPLVEEIETPLVGFYVMPDMESVKQESYAKECTQEKRIRVKSLEDMLKDQQEIYLSADAGFGKTAFSKHLAIAWCEAVSPGKDREYFKKDQLQALSNFEFLFLVSLRDSSAVCNVDEIIEQQIVKKLPPSGSKYPLEAVLRREKCLIILDGLDEWTHPENDCTDQTESIPHRYIRENCVILTTTRPWKLGVLNTSQIDKKVEMIQLGEDAISQLEKNAIRKISGALEDDVLEGKTRDFNKFIHDNGLKQMQTIPLLLMYTLCLWCNKIPIGKVKLDIYANIIEFLLSRTSQKHPGKQLSSGDSHNDIPEYFRKLDNCQRFYTLISALGKLAHHSLFNEKRENVLVFDRLVANKYLNDKEFEFSLLSGILTEGVSETVTERTSKVSFSHKTVQEFFAAIFISSQVNGSGALLVNCESVQSILDASMICEFICKMNSEMMYEILTGFMSVVNKAEKTHKYRTMTDDEEVYDNKLYHIQKMLLSCLKHLPGSESFQLCLHDYFLDHAAVRNKHLKNLSEQNKNTMKSLHVDTRDNSSSLHEINKLFPLADFSNLQKLSYRGNKSDVDISLLLLPCLQYIDLSSATCSNVEENLSDTLVKLQSVLSLCIREFTLSTKTLETLFNFFPCMALKELKLVKLTCKEPERESKRLHFDLSQHRELSKLEMRWLPPLQLNLTTKSLVDIWLCNIDLGESSLLLSSDMEKVEHIVLSYIELSAESFHQFIQVLECLPQSVRVEMFKCTIEPDTEYQRIKGCIQNSNNFDIIYNWPLLLMFETKRSTMV